MKKLKLKLRSSASDQANRPPKSRAPRLGRPKLISSWRLFHGAWIDFWSQKKRYSFIIGIVLVPVSLLSLAPSVAKELYVNTLALFALQFMVMAIIWFIVERRRRDELPTVRDAYYSGTANILANLLASVVTLLTLLPLSFGLALMAVGLVAAEVVGVYGPELLLAGFIAIVLSGVSWWLLVRLVFAPLLTISDGLRPAPALRRSWRISRGRFWATSGRLAMMGLFAVVLAVPSMLIALLFSLVGLSMVGQVLFQIIAMIVGLPFANSYIYELYRRLEADQPAGSTIKPVAGTAPVVEALKDKPGIFDDEPAAESTADPDHIITADHQAAGRTPEHAARHAHHS